MNRTKVIKAIGLHNARKAGKIPPLHVSGDSEIDYMAHAVEALVEIASDVNIELLTRIDERHDCKDLGKFISLLKSVQVPKEVVYAYPVTMVNHFNYYFEDYFKGKHSPCQISDRGRESDGFGCEWRKFTAPKELIEHLRNNNVPIKVCE
ncbi:hypothetical protein AH03_4 [Erwinia phage AH03]|uniref:Uncharacterized protein n=1 Tax=Erwinia phage AH03 TaxID=2869568 RepID=A0AAE7X0H7_9CAUD|nr:hypothetical protein AH03_4 [Erwinia phage AH03]